MALPDALGRVDRDLERGDLGKARDRLEGMIVGYPSSLEVRSRLGDVYWRLQYPERAGQHWYLFPSDRPKMDDAKRAFERRRGNDPYLMLAGLGYRGGLESVRGTYAEEVLRDLARRSRLDEAALERAVGPRVLGQRDEPFPEPWWARFVGPMLLAIAVTIMLFSCIGLITGIGMVRSLFP